MTQDMKSKRYMDVLKHANIYFQDLPVRFKPNFVQQSANQSAETEFELVLKNVTILMNLILTDAITIAQ